jgi:hypothetical protein
MPLYTRNYLKEKARQAKGTLNETRLFSEAKKRTNFDIFLCHSFDDKDVIKGIFIELTEKGYSVYVDWIVDSHLDRSNVTEESARLIRGRLESSSSLILAISENSVLSTWAPWELGVVDGHTKNCALFPIAEGSTPKETFKGREYLSIYPYITNIQDWNGRKLYAVKDASNYRALGDWVNGQKLTYNYTKLF